MVAHITQHAVVRVYRRVLDVAPGLNRYGDVHALVGYAEDLARPVGYALLRQDREGEASQIGQFLAQLNEHALDHMMHGNMVGMNTATLNVEGDKNIGTQLSNTRGDVALDYAWIEVAQPSVGIIALRETVNAEYARSFAHLAGTASAEFFGRDTETRGMPAALALCECVQVDEGLLAMRERSYAAAGEKAFVVGVGVDEKNDGLHKKFVCFDIPER